MKPNKIQLTTKVKVRLVRVIYAFTYVAIDNTSYPHTAFNVYLFEIYKILLLLRNG